MTTATISDSEQTALLDVGVAPSPGSAEPAPVLDPVAAYLASTAGAEEARESTRAAVLAATKTTRATRDAAEVELLLRVVEWCAMHEVPRDDEAMWLAGYGDHALGLGGPGCPLVKESAVVELAAALGLSTTSGAHQVAVTLELRHRLPRLWERVTSGACPVWRARRVAEATMVLCEEGAAHIDRHVAAFAHAISAAQLTRLVDEALLRWDPEAAEARRRAAADGRRVDIRLEEHQGGVVHVEAGLDLADALALEAAIRDRAAELAADGSADSLDVRRSKALGDLAVGLETLEDAVADGPEGGEGTGVACRTRRRAGRQVVLFVHLSDDARLARLDARHGTLGPVLGTQVREWCRTAAQVTVRPVLDLAEAVHCDSYEASDRLRDQTDLRDATCVFPHCTRPAVACDHDHVVAWPEGLTETENLAPACRRHHRAKTHLGWSYEVLTPGLYLWRSPLGERYLRSHAGTHPLDTVPPGPPPDPLPQRPPTARYRPAPLVEDPVDPSPVDDTPPPF